MASTASSGTDRRPGPVVHGDPGDTLLEHARDAGVVVLGNSRRGGVAGALLGSVGLPCAHHATYPLVLVPSG